jgi:hypothetical protein
MDQSLQSANDRRGAQRFGINAPLSVILGDREVPAFTRDLSNRGVYFYLAPPDNILIGREYELSIELPPETTLSTRCLIRCRVRVVRTDNASMELTGIAAEILQSSIERNAVAFD